MITLEPITRDNLRAVLRLTPRDDQENFVASNAVSVAQVYVEPDWTPLAIAADGEPVGFVLYGRDHDTGVDWIIRFMIDQHHQGKGYGRAGLRAVLERLRALPDHKETRLSYVPGNAVAEGLYRAMGFVPTGEIDDGEVIMRYDPPTEASSALPS
jgi:diamine N-acetyltransferase